MLQRFVPNLEAVGRSWGVASVQCYVQMHDITIGRLGGAESRSTDRRGRHDIRSSRATKIGGDSRVAGARRSGRDGILPEERAVSRRQGGAERKDGPRWQMADDIGSSCGVATRAEGVCSRAGSMQHYEHFPRARVQSRAVVKHIASSSKTPEGCCSSVRPDGTMDPKRLTKQCSDSAAWHSTDWRQIMVRQRRARLQVTCVCQC
jgi:hypothetical protein